MNKQQSRQKATSRFHLSPGKDSLTSWCLKDSPNQKLNMGSARTVSGEFSQVGEKLRRPSGSVLCGLEGLAVKGDGAKRLCPGGDAEAFLDVFGDGDR